MNIERLLKDRFEDDRILLNSFSSRLKIRKIVEEQAFNIYKEYKQKSKGTPGRSNEVGILASIYISCRINNEPITLMELYCASAANINKKRILKVSKIITSLLKIKLIPIDCSIYFNQIISKLKLSINVDTKARELLSNLKETNFDFNKNQMAIASAIIYISSQLNGEYRIQREISDAILITPVTISSIKYEIIEKLNLTEQIRKSLIGNDGRAMWSKK